MFHLSIKYFKHWNQFTQPLYIYSVIAILNLLKKVMQMKQLNTITIFILNLCSIYKSCSKK